MGFQHVNTTTAAKAEITSHWNDYVPNIRLVSAAGGPDAAESPVTLVFESTETVYRHLHRRDIDNEAADLLDSINKLLEEAISHYPSARRYPASNREQMKAWWMEGTVDNASNLVDEYNKKEETRRERWRREVPNGTEEMWAKYNEKRGGSILPFTFGPSILKTQFGAESRSVQSVLEALEARRAAHQV